MSAAEGAAEAFHEYVVAAITRHFPDLANVRKFEEGAYSQVYAAENRRNETVVIKVPRSYYLSEDSTSSKKAAARKSGSTEKKFCIAVSTLRECDFLRRMQHPTMVKAYDIALTDDGRVLMLEEYGGHTLDSWILTHSGVAYTNHRIRMAEHVACYLLSSLDFLHKHGLTYRDLHLRNILFSSAAPSRADISGGAAAAAVHHHHRRNQDERKEDPLPEIKLCDFGLVTTCASRLGLSTYAQQTEVRYWLDPVLEDTSNYGSGVDMWSFAHIIIRVLVGIGHDAGYGTVESFGKRRGRDAANVRTTRYGEASALEAILRSQYGAWVAFKKLARSSDAVARLATVVESLLLTSTANRPSAAHVFARLFPDKTMVGATQAGQSVYAQLVLGDNDTVAVAMGQDQKQEPASLAHEADLLYQKFRGKFTFLNRSQLVVYLADIAAALKLGTGTMVCACDMIDLVLHKCKPTEASRQTCQLLGMTALWMATKLRNVTPLKAQACVALSGDLFTLDDMLKMEQFIVKTLGFALGQKTYVGKELQPLPLVAFLCSRAFCPMWFASS